MAGELKKVMVNATELRMRYRNPATLDALWFGLYTGIAPPKLCHALIC